MKLGAAKSNNKASAEQQICQHKTHEGMLKLEERVEALAQGVQTTLRVVQPAVLRSIHVHRGIEQAILLQSRRRGESDVMLGL